MKITLVDANNALTSNTTRLLSAILRKEGFKTNLLFPVKGDQFNYYDLKEKELSQIAKKVKSSDLVAMSTLSVCSLKAKQISRTIQKELEIPLVWGGMHATALPEESLEFCDFVISGEGENALVELAKKLEGGKDFSGIKNLCFKTREKVKKNPLRPLIADLDSLPFPDFDLKSQFVLDKAKMKSLTKKIYEEKAREESFFPNKTTAYYIQSARGCPYKCTYCCQEMLNQMYNSPPVRKRSIANVIEELKFAIKELPFIKAIGFSDDDFIAYRTKEEIDEFSKIYKREIDLPFGFEISPLAVDEYKLSRLCDAGLFDVEMGIQTGSKRVSKEIYQRPFSEERIIKSAKIINKFVKSKNLMPMYDFLINNPFENENDIRETINLVTNLPKPFAPQMNILNFYPGTKLFKMGIENNLPHVNEGEYNTDFTGINEEKEIQNLYLNIILFSSVTFQNLPPSLFRLLASKPASAIGGLLQKKPLRKFATKNLYYSLYSRLLYKKLSWSGDF